MNADTQNAESKTSGDDWVILASADGFAFMVPRKVALGSGTLRNMLDEESGFLEANQNTCPVNERGAVVEKLCEYLVHRNMYENAGPKEDIPEFMTRIPPEMALELLVAADYLEA